MEEGVLCVNGECLMLIYAGISISISLYGRLWQVAKYG